MEKDQYSKKLGVYNNSFAKLPDAIMHVVAEAKQSKIFAADSTPKAKVTAIVCACKRSNAFQIFIRPCSVVAKCSACGNEKEIYEG